LIVATGTEFALEMMSIRKAFTMMDAVKGRKDAGNAREW
jgi:hypothetical protein